MSSESLVVPKENKYYLILAIFSGFAWLLLLISVVGIFYAASLALFMWLANGLLVANLKSNAVKVTDGQLSDLKTTLLEVCEKLGIQQVPEMYVLQSEGFLNAFATRHSGRHFIVIYSTILDAFGPKSEKMKFLIGHELGHIRQNHISKQIFILPALLLPLLGNAYGRARECTCDNYGAYACGDINGAIDAMMVLSGGVGYYQKMSAQEFSNQHQAERGFFVSWLELISGYPTLSQRVCRLISLRDQVEYQNPSRHPLAYAFGLFSIGGNRDRTFGILITITVVAILVGMLMPALSSAQNAAHRTKAVQYE